MAVRGESGGDDSLMTCSVDSCMNSRYLKYEYCRAHHSRVLRKGDPEAHIPIARRTRGCGTSGDVDEAPPSPGAVELDEFLSSLIRAERTDWRGAKCVTESPLLWDVDFYRTAADANAAGDLLCDGCPLFRECAASGMERIWKGQRQNGVIRAGVALDGSRSATLRLRNRAGVP